MATVDELKAQLAVAELEEKLAASKGPKDGKLKAELREARLRYRAARDGLKVTKDKRGRLVAG